MYAMDKFLALIFIFSCKFDGTEAVIRGIVFLLVSLLL